MNLKHHTVERNGYHWHIVTSGSDSAPPVLLLHCWAGNWELWKRTLEYFGDRYHFIVPDHLGFGQSDKPRGDHYGIDKQAERSWFILKHFGYERAQVMGHSMGGQIALTLAGTYPEAVERLIVVDPAVTGKLHPLSQMGIIWLIPVRFGIAAPVVGAIKLLLRFPSLGLPLMTVYFPRPHKQREAAIYWGGQIIADGQIYSSAWAQKAVLQWDVTPLLGKITAPTLAIWGEQDYCVSIRECDVLAKHISDFQAMRLPRIGHFPMIEAWDSYIQAVEGFLSQKEPSQASL
jgi:pimeloyl-ACP methyl ester carboxylesterase